MRKDPSMKNFYHKDQNVLQIPSVAFTLLAGQADLSGWSSSSMQQHAAEKAMSGVGGFCTLLSQWVSEVFLERF